jgi:predicted  nucleic acid-binding Zn-ribbon protein
MDAGDKSETAAQPASQAEISAEALTTDATGHLVDPHEKLDMSGMEEVDNLLSSLQIPLSPLPADDPLRGNADAAQNVAPPPPADFPFDIDSLLTPVAKANAFLKDTNPQAEEEPEEEPKVEPPAPPSEQSPGPDGSAADAQPPEKTQTEVRELSAELDDILAAAGDPDLPEEPTPQRPSEQEEASSVAVEEHPASQPPDNAPADNPPARTREAWPVAELTGLAEKSFGVEKSFSPDDSLPSADEAAEELALPVEESPDLSREPAELMPEVIQDAERRATEADAPEATTIAAPPEKTGESSSFLADRLQDAENRLATLEKNLREIEAREQPSLLTEHLQDVENRLAALEKGLAEIAGANSLEDFEQRLTALESASPTPAKEECPALVKENAQALHAYMELAARMDGIESRLGDVAKLAARADDMKNRLNAIVELAERVDDMETRLNAITGQFETRVEKAAAAAAAKLLREEIAKLLAS